jgi:hypothetical protein
LRVTNKLAMLSFGDNIWRPRRAALKFSCCRFAYA